MKYTNKHKLPVFVSEWLEKDEYDYIEGTYSATTLLKPVRMRLLEQRYKDSLSIDVSDLIASRFGTALHDSFERMNYKNIIQEVRLKKRLTINGKEFIITGKPDLIFPEDDKYLVGDLKTTSVWGYIFNSREEDYIKQMSVYYWLSRRNTKIPELTPLGRIFFFFTDWSLAKSKNSKDYPKLRFATKDYVLLSYQDTQAFIVKSLSELEKHQQTPDTELPLCTDKDLWKNPDKFAVMREGKQVALKVCDSEEIAKKFIFENGFNLHIKKHTIVRRPTIAKRCRYCQCTEFCSQFKKMKEQGLVEVE